MRGADTFTESPFTLHRLEDFVPPDHPLRAIRQMVNEALGKMDALFAGMYEAHSKGGRPSIAPEKLLRAFASSGVLQYPFGAPTHGASPVQPPVSLVHWPGDGGVGVGAHGVHEKPRVFAGARCGCVFR
jgi:hypothetical protein